MVGTNALSSRAIGLGNSRRQALIERMTGWIGDRAARSAAAELARLAEDVIPSRDTQADHAPLAEPYLLPGRWSRLS